MAATSSGLSTCPFRLLTTRSFGTHAATAARAVQTTRADPAGPVHLNLPFREPLLPADLRPSASTAGDVRARAPQSLLPRTGTLATWSRRSDARRACRPDCDESRAGSSSAAPVKRRVSPPRRPRSAQLAAIRSWPTRSAVSGSAHTTARASSTPMIPFSAIRQPRSRCNPTLVIRVGALPTSKPLQQFLLARPDRVQVVIDAGAPRDPSHLATSYIIADAATTLAILADKVANLGGSADRGWLDAWQAADRRTDAAIASALAREERPFEGRAVAEVAALLPEGATLVVGNSMPIRDVDAFVRGDRRRLRIVSNRGANGIDGVVSTALGAAAVADGPVVLIVGDLSFFHDLNGMFAAAKFDLDATIVVLNNDGGGIFSFLPQAEQLDATTFEALFGTPTGLDVAAAARLFGASHARPGDWDAFRRELCRAIRGHGLSVIELVTDRNQNVAQHRSVWAAVAEATAASRHGWCLR